MQNLLNGIDDPALVMRVDDALTIEGWNGPLARVTGYTAEEAIGRPLNERLHAADPSARIRNIARLRQWEFWEGTALLVDKVGALIGVRSVTTFIHLDGVPRILGVLRPMPRTEMLIAFYSQIAALLNRGLIHEHPGFSRQEVAMVKALDLMSAAGEDHAARIAYNVRQYRNKLGFSQEVLAEKVGTYRQHVVMWENARAKPNDDNLERLAKALNVEVADLWAAPPLT